MANGSVNIVLGFYSDFEKSLSKALRSYGYEVQTRVIPKVPRIIEYVGKWGADAVIVRPQTEDEMREFFPLRDLRTRVILLIPPGFKGRTSMQDVLDAGMYDALYIGREKSMVESMVRLMREGRTIRDAELYYGFENAQVPEDFTGHYDLDNEQDMRLLYEFLLDKADKRTLAERHSHLLELLPKEKREDFTLSLPAGLRNLLEYSPGYVPAAKGKRADETALPTLPVVAGEGFRDWADKLFDSYHKHEFGEWETVREADYDNDGERIRKCICGHIEREAIPMLPTVWSEQKTTAPTCTKPGEVYQTAAEGRKYRTIRIIPPVGHAPVIVEAVKPTCDREGWSNRICDRCKAVLEEKAVTAAPIGHDYTDWVTIAEPTYEVPGSQSRKCRRCGYEEIEPIPCIPYTYGSEMKEEPTCEGEGSVYRLCVETGKRRVDKVIPALGHLFVPDTVIVIEASCEEDGGEYRECLRCGKKVCIRELPAKGHEWEEYIGMDADCTNDGWYDRRCRSCRKEEKKIRMIPAKGHEFGGWITRKAASCTDDGVEERFCSECGRKEVRTTSAPGHDFGEWKRDRRARVYRRTCVRCGKTEERHDKGLFLLGSAAAVLAAAVLLALFRPWETKTYTDPVYRAVESVSGGIKGGACGLIRLSPALKEGSRAVSWDGRGKLLNAAKGAAEGLKGAGAGLKSLSLTLSEGIRVITWDGKGRLLRGMTDMAKRLAVPAGQLAGVKDGFAAAAGYVRRERLNRPFRPDGTDSLYMALMNRRGIPAGMAGRVYREVTSSIVIYRWSVMPRGCMEGFTGLAALSHVDGEAIGRDALILSASRKDYLWTQVPEKAMPGLTRLAALLKVDKSWSYRAACMVSQAAVTELWAVRAEKAMSGLTHAFAGVRIQQEAREGMAARLDRSAAAYRWLTDPEGQMRSLVYAAGSGKADAASLRKAGRTLEGSLTAYLWDTDAPSQVGGAAALAHRLRKGVLLLAGGGRSAVASGAAYMRGVWRAEEESREAEASASIEESAAESRSIEESRSIAESESASIEGSIAESRSIAQSESESRSIALSEAESRSVEESVRASEEESRSIEESIAASIAAHVHSWTETGRTAPTCVTPGSVTFTCMEDGATYSEEIPATGMHSWVETGRAAPGCAAPGSVTYQCTVCGVQTVEALPPTGVHNWVLVSSAEYNVYQCSVCGQQYFEPNPYYIAPTQPPAVVSGQVYTGAEVIAYIGTGAMPVTVNTRANGAVNFPGGSTSAINTAASYSCRIEGGRVVFSEF